MADKIRIAIVGVGNCASSLIQGLFYYDDGRGEGSGVMHEDIGGYGIGDIECVLAIDTDARKVGLDLSAAILAAPNCTKVFCPDIPETGVRVIMGRVLDGMAEHMLAASPETGFVRSGQPEAEMDDIVAALQDSKADVLVNFLPVGSHEATEFYMECALRAGVGVVNCMPVFIASDQQWEERFRQAGLPIIGDDVKAQLGATIVHRVLTTLFGRRAVSLDHTYQLNTGGNSDFLNMLDRTRLNSKKESKTEAVQSVAANRLADSDIHVGPSDFIPWLKDNKLCFLRMEGRLFGDVPMNLELRLSVEDSPNSAGVVIDAIRCCQLARQMGIAGAVEGPSAYFCKHPPRQMDDDDAYHAVEAFIAGKVEQA